MHAFIAGFFIGLFFPKTKDVFFLSPQLFEYQLSFRYLILGIALCLIILLLKLRKIHYAWGYLLSYFCLGCWWGFLHNPVTAQTNSTREECAFQVYDPYTRGSSNQFLCISHLPHQIVKLTKWAKPSLSKSHTSFSSVPSIFSRAVAQAKSPWQEMPDRQKKRLYTSALSRLAPENIDLLSSIGFGYSFGYLKNLSESLKVLGIFHMLVLSGAQISIVASAIKALNYLVLRMLLVFRLLKPHKFLTIFPVWKFIAALAVIYYIGLTNMTPPVQRAALMFLCATYWQNLGINYSKGTQIKIALICHIIVFPINFFSFSSLLTWLCYFFLMATQTIKIRSKIKKYLLLQSLNLSLIAALFCDVSFIGYIFNFFVGPVFTGIIFLSFILSPLPPYFWGADFFLPWIDYLLSRFSVFLISVSQFAGDHFWLYVKIPDHWHILRFMILLVNLSFFFFLFKQLNTRANNCYDIGID